MGRQGASRAEAWIPVCGCRISKLGMQDGKCARGAEEMRRMATVGRRWVAVGRSPQMRWMMDEARERWKRESDGRG